MVGGGTSGIGGIIVIGGRIGIVVWFAQCCDVVLSLFHGGSIGMRRVWIFFCCCGVVSYRCSSSMSDGWCTESIINGVVVLLSRLYSCSSSAVSGSLSPSSESSS